MTDATRAADGTENGLDERPAGGGTGRQGGLTSADIRRGEGVTGGPEIVEEKGRHSPNEGEGSATTGG